MYGGFGHDTYFVDNGLDQVVEIPFAGTDAVFSTVHFILPANVETLVLQGGANANGTGNALVNSIFGDSSDNRLDGQGSTDTLTGNAGNDTFAFVIGQANGDAVVDFAGNGAAAANRCSSSATARARLSPTSTPPTGRSTSTATCRTRSSPSATPRRSIRPIIVSRKNQAATARAGEEAII